jgi:hypothetical protein
VLPLQLVQAELLALAQIIQEQAVGLVATQFLMH